LNNFRIKVPRKIKPIPIHDAVLNFKLKNIIGIIVYENITAISHNNPATYISSFWLNVMPYKSPC
jgi:hypothetical protein